MRRSCGTLSALVASAVLLVSCGSGSTKQTITIGAASSLTEAFTEIGAAFEQANPDFDAQFTFASSSDLVAQITEGSPIDVFAAADSASIDRLADSGLDTSNSRVFASNSLAIIVGAGNPHGLSDLSDLADDELVLILADPSVPLGKYTEQILYSAGVQVRPSSFEQSAKAVVAKVVSGEADAGIVYSTDIRAAGETADGVDIPEAANVTTTYPIMALPGSTGAARSFIDFVMSDAGQSILAAHGFGAP